MVSFAFWAFMLVIALLIPVCMTALGRRFLKNPPKKINGGYGYRSARSMQSQQTWDFAHAYSGRFWYRAGWLMLPVSLVWMALLFGREAGTVGWSAGILTEVQMVPFLGVIPVTERALKREFDDIGRKR